MVRLKMNREEYAYDCISLVKAFYPKEKIQIHETEEDASAVIQLKIESGRLWMKVRSREEEREKEKKLQIGAEPDTLEYKRKLRIQIKNLIYEVLRDFLGRELPWGTLTGVRPTKLCTGWMEAGAGAEEAAERMEREYLCSPEKARVSARIAAAELEILRGIQIPEELSVYIGIPFCPTTCLYCSFTSYPIEQYRSMVSDYLRCLYQEIRAVGEMSRGRRITTVYVGGGTPTTLEAGQLRELLGVIQDTFDMKDVREFTVEAGRPDSITIEKLQVLKEEGVTRISINPQTMKQETLDLIGRKHTVEQIEKAFLLAREAGHDNINMDLIIGLPGENAGDVSRTLERIRALGPDSLTVHTLALKRASALTRDLEQYRELVPDDTVEMLARTIVFAEEEGYRPYYLYRQKNMAENLENVGYARPGKEGLYNILIMEEKQTILACGAGASSKFVYPEQNRIERTENVKSIRDYVERIEEMIARKRAMPLGTEKGIG